MDIVGLIRSSYRDYGTVISDAWIQYISSGFKEGALWSMTIAILIIIIISTLYGWRRWNERVLRTSMLLVDRSAADSARLRFRKRDKMLFYGRRMLRKVKTVSGQVYGGQGRKRKAVMRFAKKILQLRKDTIPMQLKTVEPPAEYLEETVEGSDRVPPDALYMLQGIRIFGHFEKPIFLRLCKHTEVINLEANQFLFKINDPDDSLFIVQSGVINVFISNADGSTLSLKTVKKGETVTSLLSFIDVLSGNPSFYKTVTAKAIEDSQVIRLPMNAFKPVFDENPDIMIRVLQVIMVRLQRVTLTALRNYLGLHSELFQSGYRQKKMQPTNTKISPSHRKGQPDINVPHSLADAVRPDMLADLSEHAPPSIASLSTRKQSINTLDQIDTKLIFSSAIESLLKELGLDDSDRYLLDENVEIAEFEPGVTLIAEGNSEDVCLYYVLSGSLSVLQHTGEIPGIKKTDRNELHVFSVYPGELVGELAVLTGEASSYTIRAKHHTRVSFIRRDIIYNKIMRERPNIILELANSAIRRISPLVRQCDYALDWIFLESGRAVYRQDENSDSTYIVLSGRMRSVITQASGKKEIVGEYGKGDLVGIVEMITSTSRTTTVMAVRDSEIAKLPEGLFNAIKLRYPIVVTKLISLLSHRILGSMQSKPGATTLEANPVTHKFSTVALVPVGDDVPLTAFTYELYHSLCAIGPTLRLTSDVVRKALGPTILESQNEYRLTSWLAQQEDRNIITLYQCDNALSAWTQRCMRQADVILIVGIGDRSTSVGKFEREIDRLAMRTQKELVLLHPEATNAKPHNTILWLNMRPWVTNHHHIQCPKRMFTRKSQYRINDLYSRVLMSEPNMHSDFSRLARWLTGNSVGLVLGGGGARGAAHIGMIKAMQEAGIPIDMVGGVSIGAFMGALWCAERNITTVTQKAREWSKKMTQWGRQLLDLTYPITSMFSGREFNQTIRETFGDIYIEDLWIPYFTLTTDITASCSRTHTNGSLWRFVRASMSLSGYMPPLCDPSDAHLLLDGGYCNNLPADVMRNLGAEHIIAVDVGSQDDTDLTNYGDDLSGWWLLYKKWNPFTSPVKVPDLPDIQSRLAYVSCVRQLEKVKNSDYCEYIRPPIDKYKTLAFGSFDEIRDVGYVHGKNYFDTMAKAGRLGRFNQWFSKQPPQKQMHSLSEYTFVDLAQIVCKIPETNPDKYSFSEDEEFDGYISEPSTFHSNAPKSRIKRTGGSLSLSENEMDDSDEMEIPLSLNLDTKMKIKSFTGESPDTESPTTTDINKSASQCEDFTEEEDSVDCSCSYNMEKIKDLPNDAKKDNNGEKSSS
ncbi:neuropathy target esterase sws isoform X1 [Hermetia illucens]|uniref:neuropathy target esterase sws isoform X1 n=1 Tax=Hermetia illucens TaxID=343691 RepID=UPI0018CC4B2C|nr:neuropathy target esterase sws isoform X1 [Hermetia illucens]XP_037919483.1 neuropathy target esterase sws isoform X1 [Hermetia illucens]